jgi:hypothetical protein
MTKFVIDCGVVLKLAGEGFEGPAEHELLAPTILRSQTLPALHEAVHAGEIPLQADAFVTLDAELARRVEGVVSTATIEALRTA